MFQQIMHLEHQTVEDKSLPLSSSHLGTFMICTFFPEVGGAEGGQDIDGSCKNTTCFSGPLFSVN